MTELEKAELDLRIRMFEFEKAKWEQEIALYQSRLEFEKARWAQELELAKERLQTYEEITSRLDILAGDDSA